MAEEPKPFVLILPQGSVQKTDTSIPLMVGKTLPKREVLKLTRDKVVQHMEKVIWVVTYAYGDNYYDVQKGSSLVLDFDFGTGQLTPTGNYSNDNQTKHKRVFNTTGIKLQVGDQCIVGYRGQDVKQKPFIKSVFRRPFGQQTEVVVAPPEDPIVDIPVVANTWVQHSGYWFTPKRSITPQKVFYTADPATVEVTNETVAWEVVESTTWLHFSYELLDTEDFEVRVDSVATWSGPPGPSGVTVFGTSARPDLGIPRSHTAWVVPSVYTSEVVMADYKHYELSTGDTSTFIDTPSVADGGSDALTSTMQFRGIALFPYEENQIVAALTGEYSQNGSVDTTVYGYQDTITATAETEGQVFNTAEEPIALPEIYASPIAPYGLQGGLALQEEGPGSYALLLTSLNGSTAVCQYLVKENLDTFYSESFTGDGVQTEFVIGGGPASYTTPGGTVSGPAKYIESVLEIRIAGVPQSSFSYSFFEDTVTFMVPPPNGDDVSMDLEAWDVVQQEDLVDGNVSEFTLAHTPAITLIWVDIDSEALLPHARLNTTTGVVTWLQFIADGEEVILVYDYAQNLGDAYDITKVTVIEKNVQTEGQTTLETPVSGVVSANPVLPFSSSAGRSYYKGGAGQLFYDVVKDCYTIAGPLGIYWRSRTPLTLPAPSQANPSVHYTHTAWPADGTSADRYYVEDLEMSIARRPQPWLGFSAAGPYALQGSWARVGGFRGDTAFNIHLWRRDPVSYVWALRASIPVTSLCGDHSEEYPIRVCGHGMVGLETGGPSNNTAKNTNWPCLRNYDGWVVGASWIVHDYANDFAGSPVTTPDTIGWADAGLTINVISPSSGVIKASLTLRCDKTTVLDGYLDHRYNVDKAVTDSIAGTASVIDKYVTNNPAYWPPASGSDPLEPYLGQISWIGVSDFFADPPDGQTWFIGTQLTSADDGDEPRILNYPGAPSIQGGGSPTYGINWRNDSTNENTPENIIQSCSLAVDETNHIYATVSFPVWVRTQDYLYTNPEPVQVVTHTTVYEYAGGIYTNPNGFTDVPLGGLASSIISTSAYGGPYAMFHPSAYTGVASLFNRLRFYPETVFLGPDELGQDHWEYVATTITIVYTEWVISSELSAVPYSMARCAEFPTFLGFQCSPMPYMGYKVVDYTSGTKKQYASVRKLFLMKFHYQDNEITETWRKDVTEYCTSIFGPSVPAMVDNLPNDHDLIAETIAVGRFIFLLRIGGRVDFEATTIPIQTKNYLEAYENGESAPLTYVHRVDIGASSVLDSMTCDVDADGREHVTIVGSAKTTTVHFAAVLSDPPTVTHKTWGGYVSQPPAPQATYQADRMARGADSYYWEDSNNTIKRREMQ